MNMKRLLHLVMLLLSLSFMIGAVTADDGWWWDDHPVTRSWWANKATHTVNGQLGYVLNTTRLIDYTFKSLVKAGNHTGYWSIRIYVRVSAGSETELTDGYSSINMSRDVNGEGIVTKTWKPDLTTLTIGDAIRVNVHMKIDDDPWTLKATFISSQLDYGKIKNETWTLKIYTKRSEAIGNTYIYTQWGNASRYFQISNIKFIKLSPWETQDKYMLEGDLIKFLFAPWAYFLGGFNMMYLFIVLFLEMTLYLKYEQIEVPIVFLWIFGGTGGLLTVMIPSLGLYLSWFFVALGFASTLYLMMK